ncbi:histidine triad nucleotide-binding protein [Alkaliphilus hydrothermalis]|uniref:Histidine triad (HIT) family protein n=1 Tax=Alkaliphilus hydrothermalis TaxID=1482730 RepID=A0ABS2NNY1_9FIRM|nr:histidine triad nucleotide-binding protein [Alkaliphilus hydrothermalis]MBM7614656.1 histidine triad (HIT) family protein [Alkaliphilus hydrothermalis]
MSECIFCKIVNGEIPAKKVYENEKVLAFHDISPVAPIHLLIIPKKHIPSVLDVEAKDAMEIMPEVFVAVSKLAKDFKLEDAGFRLVNNCGSDGGQTVAHLHFHLLGGRQLQWPPG